MLRSERSATRVASLRATRALASRRGHLARRKIGVPAFVEALWALVAPDARAFGVASPDALADPPDGAVEGEAGDPSASPDETEASGEGEAADETEVTKTKTARASFSDARSRFHALRALIAIVSASWRGAELLVGGAPDTSRGARAPAFHRDLAPLTRLVRPAAEKPGPDSEAELFRVGEATREKAARLLFLLARTAHGRAALCHEEGANLPDALVAAMEAEGASLRGETTSTTSTTEAMEAMETGDGAPFEGSKKKPREVAAARRCRVAATCARLLGSLDAFRAHDPAFATVAIAAEQARARAASEMLHLFFRAPTSVPVAARVAAGEALARLVAVDARVARACVAAGALAAVARALPAADRLEGDPGRSDGRADGDNQSASMRDSLFAEAFFRADDDASARAEEATSSEEKEAPRDSAADSDSDSDSDPRGGSRLSEAAPVPATASFAAAALGLLEALAEHAFARDAARDYERAREGGTPWAWTLLHQAMPAAGAEADAAEAPPRKSPEADDAGAAGDAGAAAAPAGGADPADEEDEEDVVDADPASPEGEDGGDAPPAAATAAPASAPAPPFPERFERFPRGGLSSARDGRDVPVGTERDADEDANGNDAKEEGDAFAGAFPVTGSARDADWRALRARGLASAFSSRIDRSARPETVSREDREADDDARRFVPGDAPWNDPEVCARALRALDALARDDGGRDDDDEEDDENENVLAALARDGGAGTRFLEAVLAGSTRARRFFACVEPAARLLAALAEAAAARAANGEGNTGTAGGSDARPARALAGLVLFSSERDRKRPHLFGSPALRGVLASALASEPLELDALPRRPRAPESTAAPPPAAPPPRPRFTPASLRGALLAGWTRTTAAAFAATPGTGPAEGARVPTEGQDAPDAGELVEVVTVAT